MLLPGEEFYLSAFWDLSTCRQLGMAQGPIPWNVTVYYAERAGLDEDLAGIFMHVLRELDCEYLEWSDKETERRRDKGKGVGNRTVERPSAGNAKQTDG
jgi:hypothetical protein